MAGKSTRRESTNVATASANKVAAVPVAKNCSSNPAPAIIGVNAPLPMRFETIEDAFDAREELKIKLDTFTKLLKECDNIIMNSKGEIFYVRELPKRIETEMSWCEVSTAEGRTFGFVDPEYLKSCDDSLNAQRIAVETDGVQVSMIFVDLAHVSGTECSDPIERWHATVDRREDFERLIINPYKELLQNYEGVISAINRMADQIGS